MKLERVIEILEKHQEWRRDQNVPPKTEMQSPVEIGTAIDYALSELKKLRLGSVIERYSGKNLMKLQKHFVSLYGSDEMAQEKANSFAVGFGKACELIIKDLNAL